MDGDRVAHWRQVSEHYRSLTDDELIAIAREKEDLTEVAQQALAAEIQSRKLEIPVEEPESDEIGPELPDPQRDPESPYDEARELVQIETVYSRRDAQQLEGLLNEDGIPFYLGKEKATRSEDVKSDFSKGVPVAIMRIGLPYATRARMDFKPLDDPEGSLPEKPESEMKADPLFCPKCRSEAVLLDSSRPDATLRSGTRFLWRCEACGKRWEDDGVLDEE